VAGLDTRVDSRRVRRVIGLEAPWVSERLC
jgi:hypothetical protein